MAEAAQKRPTEAKGGNQSASREYRLNITRWAITGCVDLLVGVICVVIHELCALNL